MASNKLIPADTPNDGLPASWVAVDEAPMIAGRPPASAPPVGLTGPGPYFAATLPLTNQLIPDIMPTRFPGGLGGYRVQPPGASGVANANSAIKSNVTQIIEGGGGSSTPSTPQIFFPPFTYMLAPPIVTPPVLSQLTWGNQGSASAVYNAGGALYVSTPSDSSGWKFLYKPAPATPWTLTIGFVAGFGAAADAHNEGGIILRESATGKLQGLFTGTNSLGQGPILLGDNFNNYTTPGSPVNFITTYSIWPSPLAWLRVTNDGTYLSFYSAIDGQNFKLIFKENNNAFFTTGPDQIGIGLSDTETNAGFVKDGLFFHWAGI